MAEYPEFLKRDDPPTALYGDDACLTIKLPAPGRNLAMVAQWARRQAVKAAEEMLKNSSTVPKCINLDTGNTFFRVFVQRYGLKPRSGMVFSSVTALLEVAASKLLHAYPC